MKLNIIPTPQQLSHLGSFVDISNGFNIDLRTQDAEDQFAAEYLAQCLSERFQITSHFGEGASEDALPLIIERSEGPDEGYTLLIQADAVTIRGNDAAGVYYACQTIRQAVQLHNGNPQLPIAQIEDAPRMKYRAMHIDNKHHQSTFDYVKFYIREMAHYKANMLVWEWEDKFCYPSHPQVGAPGAFDLQQMQELTAYAKQHHIELVPLVQGLGHVSFILKHPEFAHLREIPDSDWEFCPLNDGSYELLFELWKDAMDATPGSRFFHIGSDETYELGLGVECGCAEHAAKHSNDSLMRIFIDRCTKWVEEQGRTCLSWGGQWKPDNNLDPMPSMIWTDGDSASYIKQSIDAGFPCWIYAPNNDVPPLITYLLPWHKHARNKGINGTQQGSFGQTSSQYISAAEHPKMEGSICTSWEDSGLHNQMWILHHICACEYSWNPTGTPVEEWSDQIFENYFGPQQYAMRECQHLLQENAEFFDDCFERRVWHYGTIGKIHIPDFPREGLEFNPFFKSEYQSLIVDAAIHLQKLDRIEYILNKNLENGVYHSYDIEIMLSCAKLMRVSANLIETMRKWEDELSDASLIYHHSDKNKALECLHNIEYLIEQHLAEKEKVYKDLVTLWERTRLPKGYSTKEKPYFYKRERARHFANKTPDMRYLVYDMDKLGIETYLEKLKTYNQEYENNEVSSQRTSDHHEPSLCNS